MHDLTGLGGVQYRAGTYRSVHSCRSETFWGIKGRHERTFQIDLSRGIGEDCSEAREDRLKLLFGEADAYISFLQLVAAASSDVGDRKGTRDRDEKFRLIRRVRIKRRSRGKA